MGTNSFHMIVAELLEEGSFRILDRQKEWVRLGDSIAADGALDEAAIERLMAALAKLRKLAVSYQATPICIATAALREAGNREEILARIKEQLDLDVEVVSGQEEARLIFQGVRSEGYDSDEATLVIDIGGGSTEVIVGSRQGPIAADSMHLGARRLARLCFADGRYSKKQIADCRQLAANKIQSIAPDFLPYNRLTAVGTSGTIRALAQLCCHYGKNNDPKILKLKHLQAILLPLIADVGKGGALPGLEAERRETIVAGAIILIEAMEALGLPLLHICNSALREGVVMDWVEANATLPQQPMQSGVRALVRRFQVDSEQAARVGKSADWIFGHYAALLGLDEEARQLLAAACALHEIGLAVSHKRMHLHGAYIVEHADLTGMSLRQQQMVALVIRFHRKERADRRDAAFARLRKSDGETVVKLAAILRLAAALNRTQSGEAAHPSLTRLADGWNWHFERDWCERHEVCLWLGEREKPIFEQLIGGKLRFERL